MVVAVMDRRFVHGSAPPPQVLWGGFIYYELMGSQPLILKNISQSFIRAKDKTLFFSTIDKERSKTVFASRTILGIVFGREYAIVFCAIRVEICLRVKNKYQGII